MIAKRNRFNASRDIENIYRRGRAIRHGVFSLKYVPAKKTNYRLAVVVSKKVSKSAVVRNRIRRRVFEQFRLIYKSSGQQPLDMVVSIFDPGVASMPANELASICRNLFEKAAHKRSS